jgi:hypothetical protein
MVRPSFGSCPEQMIGSTTRMQGKDASEQETTVKCNAGIDVSKNYLDVHVLLGGQSVRVVNTDDGIRKLKRWLARFDLALVVVEATGKWHRRLQRSLHASGFAAAVVDPSASACSPRRRVFSPRPIASMPVCWPCLPRS